MKLRSLNIEKAPEIMIIPMIDIIFFLLVFFMLTTLHMVEQHTIAVNLPQAAQGSQDKIQRLNVTIAKDGKLWIGEEAFSKDEAVKRIKAEVKADPNGVIILRGDKELDYGKVIAVLDELKKAGAQRISIAVESKTS
jgi:biopolymer transport protein ExbD